ncbi:MAG: MFS transporter [Planctomycetota bacterium]
MRLNPFAGLPNPRAVWAWGMFDLANQSFTLLINTLLFAIFFKEVVVGDPAKGDSLWSIAFSGSMLLVVICSPIFGAIADVRGMRKRFLLTTGVLCAVLTCALAFAQPGLVVLAMLLYIPANFCYQIGENFLASFLPSVSTPRNIGRVSATGWAMGYVGALLLLVLTLGAMLTLGLEDPPDWRPLFVFAGVWFLLNLIPAALNLKEPPTLKPANEGRSLVGETFARLRETVRSAAEFRQLVLFLGAFFVFGMGVQTVIAFAAILAGDFGIEGTGLVLFVLQITLTAGATAIATGFFQDRIGGRTTVIVYLALWMFSSMALFGISLVPDNPESLSDPSIPAKPQWLFWVVGNGIGFGIGGIGTASRSLVGKFTPAHKTAEFFGLWGMVYKFAGVVGVLSFGQVKAWIGMSASLALLFVFFAVGLFMTLRVRETGGLRAARRAERSIQLPSA